MILVALNMALGVRPMSLRILQQKNTVEIDQDEAARRLHRVCDRHLAYVDSPSRVNCIIAKFHLRTTIIWDMVVKLEIANR